MKTWRKLTQTARFSYCLLVVTYCQCNKEHCLYLPNYIFATPPLIRVAELAALFSVEPLQSHCAILFSVPGEKAGARKRAAAEPEHMAEC